MQSDGILDDIKGRLDIIELISEYISLKKSGQNYKGLCPFHSEKTPSFIVSPHKQIFHCFGCGSGGDIFGFVMKYENLSFNETLQLLAKKAGVRLNDYDFKKDSTKEAIKDMQKEALAVFAENLERSKSARDYLLKRGLEEGTIKAFSLGYAEKSWHSLYEHLKVKGFSDSLILQSGLVSPGSKGSYDIFRDRIMFPIFDTHGDVIAFGGRVMDSAMPKYLNSPDTALFKKGETLYALNMAHEDIRKTGYATLVEGYLDVIMCHQHGFKNTVAPLGTSLTEGELKRERFYHIGKLKRYTDNILLIFDGDTAGIMAAKRLLPLILEHGIRSKILLLPGGEDPDSFLRKNGAGRLEELISEANSPLDFILKTSRQGKTETVREALGIILKLNDAIFKEELITELSSRSRMPETTLRAELKKLAKSSGTVIKSVSAPLPAGTIYDEEVLLLSIALSFPDKIEAIFEEIPIGSLKNSTVKRVFESFKSGKDIDSFMETAGDEEEEEKALIRMLSLKPGFEPSEVDRNISDCIRKIKRRALDEEITSAQAQGDLRLLSSLLTERKTLIGETK